MKPTPLSLRIRALRAQVGESRVVFGRRFYRSGRTVEQWELGSRRPDALVQQALDTLQKHLPMRA
jgi:DNA-binding transcriptional regulator YiaG